MKLHLWTSSSEFGVIFHSWAWGWYWLESRPLEETIYIAHVNARGVCKWMLYNSSTMMHIYNLLFSFKHIHLTMHNLLYFDSIYMHGMFYANYWPVMMHAMHKNIWRKIGLFFIPFGASDVEPSRTHQKIRIFFYK